jgi:hypothetical protein
VYFVIALLTIDPAHAGPNTWGSFKDNGCLNIDHEPGVSVRSAVLHDIPADQSWEEACADTPKTLEGYGFRHPAVCLNLGEGSGDKGTNPSDGSLDSGALYGPSSAYTQAFVNRVGEVDWSWPSSSSPLPGYVPDDAEDVWEQRINDAIASREVAQYKQMAGGLSMWGIFFVADAKCLPPAYHRKPAPANWDDTQRECASRGMRLCRQDEVCGAGNPLPGRPAGDVWMATGDDHNAWVSVGTSYDERLCKTHSQALGTMPAWGTATGPEAVTGEETAYRCCDTRTPYSWGEFKDDGCVDKNQRPGLRAWSAVLHDIPHGVSWETSCKATSAQFGRHVYPHPALCVNTGAGANTAGLHAQVNDVAALSPWPFTAPVDNRGAWQSTLANAMAAKPVVHTVNGAGGQSMWGVFLVPDGSCLP